MMLSVHRTVVLILFIGRVQALLICVSFASAMLWLIGHWSILGQLLFDDPFRQATV